ncbi:hypothetical protein GGF42_001005 [Coemansia sp. RSA 2424]|nr:hypothetical protein GGF42_001005 [Coemansia sp. RSA 2424]
MEHFDFPIGDTYSILARQGYAAQSRRKTSSRRMAHPLNVDATKDGETCTSSGNCVCFLRGSCGGRSRVTERGCVAPIDMSFCGEQHAMLIDSAYASPSSYASSSDTSTPATPSSPQFRSMLHERYSTQLQSMAIQEEDGEGGTVFHNGLKRLSMSEAKLVLLGRPRIVNM